ncbi:MAG: hypothetical protein JRJ00_00035 [Deltaproteobacteria bacterium]|nr:hypothetical protein [Deltaproteobacteria bacterium]
MELESFRNGLIKYYGEHENKHVETVTIAYVKSHYDSNNYENLLQSIMKSHPVKWGFPDVSAVEDSQETLYKRENKSYRKVVLSKSEWTTSIDPLTEEEMENSIEPRKRWNEILERANNKCIIE